MTPNDRIETADNHHCLGGSEPNWSEADRLVALERYAILDTEKEEAFESVVALAADLFDAPIAVINFIAADRQWFKAEIGIGADELPLDVSICRHAILEPGMFVVPDLSRDPRFENNPLVNIAGGLRFYAGALLETSDGLPLGTICVLDKVARPDGISARQERALATLAGQTMAQLELRKSERVAHHERVRAEKRARRISLLAEASSLLFSAPDPITAIPELFALVNDRIGLPVAFHYRCSANALQLVAAAGLTAEQEKAAAHIDVGQTVCGLVALRREAMHVTDIQTSNDPHVAFLKTLGLDSYFSMPLLVSGTLLGTISFGRRGSNFSPGEIETLSALAAHLLTALERAQADARLAASFAGAGVGMVLMDSNHRIARVNDAYCSITRKHGDDLIGTTCLDITHPDDIEKHRMAVASLEAGSENVSFEKRYLVCDEIEWVRLTLSKLGNGDVLAIVEDVSARKAGEEALRASEQRFRAVQDTSIDGFMVLESVRDAQGTIVDFRWLEANEAAERIVGRPRAWFVGRRLLEEMPGNREQGLFDAYVRVVETGEPWTEEFTYRQDGVDAYIRLVAAKAGDGFAVSFADLSVRARAEAALAESEARYRALFAASPTPFLLLAPDAPRFTVIEVNDAYLAATKTTRDGLIGRGLFEAFPDNPDDPSATGVANLRASLDRVLATKEADTLPAQKYDIPKPDGGFEERWWDPVNAPMLGIDGEITAIVHHVVDITARHEAEARVRESEAQLRNVLDGMAEGFALLDRDFTILEINKEGFRLNGMTAPQLVGQTHWDAFPDTKDSELGRLYQKAMKERVAVSLEHRYVFEDGRALWLDMRAYPSGDDQLALFWRDVTDRREAEERLRANEERLRRATSAGRMFGWETDVKAGTITWGRGAAELLGVAEDKLPNDIAQGQFFVSESERERLRSDFATAVVRGELSDCAEFRGIDNRAWRADYDIIYDSEGSIKGVIGITQDVTERRAVAQALAESEERYRSVFEQAGVGVARVSPDGPFIEINDRYCELLGRSREDLLGNGWKEITHPDDLDTDVANVERLLAGEANSFQMEKRYIRPDGSSIWVDMAVALIRDSGGTPSFFVAVVQDIDARKQAERQLEELNRSLEARVEERTATLAETAKALEAEMSRREAVQAQLVQAQKMEALGQLVGGVAHDFNNILAAIQSAFLLLERRVPDDESRFVVQEGRKAGERATKLIRQMLAFARRERLQADVVDLRVTLPEAREMLAHAVGTLVECKVEVAPDTWPILVDRQQLEIALLNLAVNARDAMPGSGRVTVSARNMQAEDKRPVELGSGDHIIIEVRDNGSGMDAATSSRVFEPFFTTKSVGQGTGLGLAQVHGVVSAAGGAITVQSAPEAGTALTLYLPRSAILDKPGEVQVRDLNEHARATLLLVDDDDQVRPVTAAFLRELGYTVVEADCAPVALAMAELHPIDLMLTDVVMPGTDGPSLLRKMRELRPALPTIYVTGFAGERALDDAPVLLKPYSAEELETIIRQALE